jgi:hypothetical protein
MAKTGGPQVELGIGIETTAGTAVAAADYLKWDTLSFQSMSDKVMLNSARGIRNKASNSTIINQYGKGSIEFFPSTDILPYILGLLLGTRNSATHAGESTVYDHTFTVQNSNASMKTATFYVAQGGVQTEKYTNCVVDSFDLTVEKDLIKAKIGVLGNFPTTGSISSSYTQDTLLARNDMVAYFGSTLAAATGTAGTTTLTSAGVFADADTITIGSITYTMKTALTNSGNTPYEVLIGVSATVSLDNLKSAINGTGTAGTTMGFGTTAHPQVKATTKTATTLLIQALQLGTTANSIATTKVSANFTWTGATINAGTPGTGTNPTPLVAFTLAINNNVLFQDAFLSGSTSPAAGGFIAGPLEIKGSYTLQFADVVELGKYQQNTNSAMIVNILGALLGVVQTQELIQFKLGRLVLTKAPIEYQLEGIVLLKQEFEVQYDGTDKEVTAVITNTYVGTNYQ